jgi:hypothetical protein
MRNYKSDSICKKCSWASEFNHHKCHYTVSTGNYFKSAISGRKGLSEDGYSCKYFADKNNSTKSQ